MKNWPDSSLDIERERVKNFPAMCRTASSLQGDRKIANALTKVIHEKIFYSSSGTSMHISMSKSEDGYWRIFSKRFPGLFIAVYKIYRHKVDFKSSIEPKFLTNVHEEACLRSVGINTRPVIHGMQPLRRSPQTVVIPQNKNYHIYLTIKYIA